MAKEEIIYCDECGLPVMLCGIAALAAKFDRGISKKEQGVIANEYREEIKSFIQRPVKQEANAFDDNGNPIKLSLR